jgi:hypothetical protein
MWEPSQSTDPELTGLEQWNELIQGVRWYRKPFSSTVLAYTFAIEDPSTVQSLTHVDLENFAHPDGIGWQEGWWWANSSNFPCADTFWRPDLAKRAAAAEQQTQPQAPPPPAPAVPAGPVPGIRLADPTVVSAGPPQYAPRGACAWTVTMTVNAVQAQDSWIIQKVHESSPTEQTTFWEAFPVPANQQQSSARDVYQNNAKKTSGEYAVKGLMQHHVFGGGPPPGMQVGGGGSGDREQYTSIQQPPFWVADDGTPHNLDFVWGAFNTTLTTVPPSGAPEKKGAAWQLDSG